ncbi:MAG: sensor histidine kinase [Chloroflexota bacterium]
MHEEENEVAETAAGSAGGLRTRRHRLARARLENARLRRTIESNRRPALVGRFALAVAHDLDAMLSVVAAHADAVLAMPGLPTHVLVEVDELRVACEAATDVARDLLAYGRIRDADEPADADTAIQAIEPLLRRLVGSAIDLSVDLDACGGRVDMRAAALQQVVLNLVMNAREAMPSGGSVTIRTRIVEADAPWVELEVADTGIGMTARALRQAFDPFFTTKTLAATGLGLPTARSIVSTAGGTIVLTSRPRRGTRATIRLPVRRRQG